MGVLPDQGPDAAALELWPQQPAREPGVAGRAAAHLPRGEVQLALGGHARPGRQPMSGGPVLMIMAGGTGGHVFPALAVANVLRARGVAVVWLGVPGSMESRLVPAQGFPIEWVRVARYSRQGRVAWAAAPLRIAKARGAGHARAQASEAAFGARHRRLRQRTWRHCGLADARSAPDPRAERDRRHDQPLACTPGNTSLGGISGQLRCAGPCQYHRQSGARGYRGDRSAGTALRGAPVAYAFADFRRQPGRAAAERGAAASDCEAQARGSPAGPAPVRRAGAGVNPRGLP